MDLPCDPLSLRGKKESIDLWDGPQIWGSVCMCVRHVWVRKRALSRTDSILLLPSVLSGSDWWKSERSTLGILTVCWQRPLKTKEAHLGPAWAPWQEVCREAIVSLSVDSGFGGERQNMLTMSTETTDHFLSPVMDKWNLELPNYELLGKIILGTQATPCHCP